MIIYESNIPEENKQNPSKSRIYVFIPEFSKEIKGDIMQLLPEVHKLSLRSSHRMGSERALRNEKLLQFYPFFRKETKNGKINVTGQKSSAQIWKTSIS